MHTNELLISVASILVGYDNYVVNYTELNILTKIESIILARLRILNRLNDLFNQMGIVSSRNQLRKMRIS